MGEKPLKGLERELFELGTPYDLTRVLAERKEEENKIREKLLSKIDVDRVSTSITETKGQYDNILNLLREVKDCFSKLKTYPEDCLDRDRDASDEHLVKVYDRETVRLSLINNLLNKSRSDIINKSQQIYSIIIYFEKLCRELKKL